MTTRLGEQPIPDRRIQRRLAIAVLAGLLLAATALGAAGRAPAQSLEQKRAEAESALSQVSRREGVLTTEISRFSNRISSIGARVAELRNRAAEVTRELARLQKRLTRAQKRLARLRTQLERAIGVLEDRLIDIYKSGRPDLISVVLSADGFDDLVNRAEYLQALERQDSGIILRVRALREEAETLVTTIRESRDAVADRKRELDRNRAELESQTVRLARARSGRRAVLGRVQGERQRLEGDLTAISAQIAEQLGGSAVPLPAGPIQGGSNGFIWPVNGPITSGFGFRWGRMHEGIDISAPGGTPIRAAKSGNIVIAAYTGGYGNYTCIDHGGGLASCYAHQSAFARTGGFVSQGAVIGYVGNTGHSFGNHLHFEVRINGSAVDPLGYL